VDACACVRARYRFRVRTRRAIEPARESSESETTESHGHAFPLHEEKILFMRFVLTRFDLSATASGINGHDDTVEHEIRVAASIVVAGPRTIDDLFTLTMADDLTCPRMADLLKNQRRLSRLASFFSRLLNCPLLKIIFASTSHSLARARARARLR